MKVLKVIAGQNRARRLPMKVLRVLRSLGPGRNSQAWGSQVTKVLFRTRRMLKQMRNCLMNLTMGHRRPKRTRRIIKALEILRYLWLEAWALLVSNGLPGALCGFPGALLYSLGVLLGVLLGLPGFS